MEETTPSLRDEFPKLAEIADRAEAEKKAELSRYDAESVVLINEQAGVVDEAERAHEELKKQASEAKKELEAEELKLRALIKERRENRGKPRQATLLDLVPEGDETPPAQPVTEAAADPLADLWQEYPLERMGRFGMTESDIEKLRVGVRKRGLSTVPLHTVGDVARYTAGDAHNPSYPHELSDYNGIAGSIAARIEDALMGFHAWWGNGGGAAEYAAERGLTNGQGNSVEPGQAADAGGSGGDRVGGDQQPGGKPAGDPAGDAGQPAAVESFDLGDAATAPGQLGPIDPPFAPSEGVEEFSLGDD